MRTTRQVVIFLGFLWLAKFSGAVVYRTVITDNEQSQKEDKDTESNVVIDEAEVDKIKFSGISNDEFSEQGGVKPGGINENAELSGSGWQERQFDTAENDLVIIKSRGMCTCIEENEMGEEDGLGSGDTGGQDTQKTKDEIEQSGGQNNIENSTDNYEAIGSGGEADNIEEEGNQGSGEQEDMGSETSPNPRIEEIEEQNDSSKKTASNIEIGLQIFTFSPLDC